MQQVFETLIETFLTDKVGISKHFLSETLSLQLKSNLLGHLAQNDLITAGTGNENTILKDTAIRSDKIYWLDKTHNDPHENAFFALMDEFVSYLNETCYTGITSYEFHYALYEKGSFYKRHLDRFRNDDRRLFSMITYLNPDWKEGDGGELSIFHDDGQTQNISPMNGKSVFFRSDELEHEVLQTLVPRMSITGWLKR
ncbi:MAG: 2OG-Fe(II) oxygenase [Saprospiraceae bacterium]|nr:2OG-Fe(II) oxygenase [Saprospiraceae bacterium]